MWVRLMKHVWIAENPAPRIVTIRFSLWNKDIMKCPNCATELRMSERKGVEIDYCPTCRGVWLDRGELDKLLEHASREQEFP